MKIRIYHRNLRTKGNLLCLGSFPKFFQDKEIKFPSSNECATGIKTKISMSWSFYSWGFSLKITGYSLKITRKGLPHKKIKHRKSCAPFFFSSSFQTLAVLFQVLHVLFQVTIVSYGQFMPMASIPSNFFFQSFIWMISQKKINHTR